MLTCRVTSAAKGFLGTALHVFAQQSNVIQFLHLHLNAAKAENVTFFFEI